MKKVFSIAISTIAFLQAPVFAANCPSGSMKGEMSDEIYYLVAGWEGDHILKCKISEEDPIIQCPGFTARNGGNQILSKQGKWVNFYSHDVLPEKNKLYRLIEREVYDEQSNSIWWTQMKSERRGNTSATPKYIEFHWHWNKRFPCENVSF